jgi:hydrogenase nickel incorporation protein HypA/HybF
MHELALMNEVVAAVSERCAESRVSRVRLEVGRLSGALPDALRFCFDVCAQGTLLEGARLDIDEVPARARCRACGASMEWNDPLASCACGSLALDVIGGQELRIRSVEVV